METSQINDNQIMDSLIANAQSVDLHGATSDTYYARLHGRRVFIKRLKEEYRLNPRYLSALEKEFNVGFRLENKALPRYLSLENDAIVMDYVEGVTLSQFVAENPNYFSVDKNIRRFMLQLLDCVNYLHQHSILHLDLKPQNIMMSHIDNDVRIVDFGFCYADTYNDTTGYTNSYAAPELKNATEIKIGSHTDIYAIGKILEYILNGRRKKYYYNIAKKCQNDGPFNRPDIASLITSFSTKEYRGKMKWIVIIGVVVISIIGAFIYSLQKMEANQHIAEKIKEDSVSNAGADTIFIEKKGGESSANKEITRNEDRKIASEEKEYKYPAPDYPFQSKASNMGVKKNWYKLLRPIYDEMLAHYMATDSMMWFDNAFNVRANNIIEDEDSEIYRKYSSISIDDIYNDGMHVHTMIHWMHQGLPIEISGYKKTPRPDLTKYANEQIAIFESR